MALKINPKASRNKNLYVFSHEHHHALVFASRLQKSEKTDKNTLKRYVHNFWGNYLDSHFSNEESSFLHLIDDPKIKDQFLSEHEIICSLANDITISKKDITTMSLELSELIRQHVKFEEKILFPWLQKNLTEEQLDKIGDSLKDVNVQADEFEPHFWE
jgi:hemerythrin-like domain-containing protein